MTVIWHDINKMTSNTSLSPIVVLSNKMINNNSTSYRAFNGTENSGATDMVYSTSTATDTYIGIDFGQTKPLSVVKIAFVSVNNVGSTKTITIETSDDGENWTFNKEVTVEYIKELDNSTGSASIYTFDFNYTEAQYIRFTNMYATSASGSVSRGQNLAFREVYIGYEIPTYKATIELYDSNTLSKITTSVSATLLKNSVSNKTLTFTTGSLLVDDLDGSSTWSVRINENTNYNALSATTFTPAYSNPIVKLYLKPTVKKKFNFKDENGVALSGKSVKLKIYKDGSNTALVDTTVTSSTYTTTTLYDGNYTYEITCEGYNKISGTLAYDDSELNINFTIYVPINKTLILHQNEYKRIEQKIDIKELIPILTSNTSSSEGTAFSSSELGADYSAWKSFDGTSSFYPLSSNVNEPFYLGFYFNEKKSVYKYTLKTSSYTDGYALKYTPTSFDFEGSDDKSTWVTLDSQRNIPVWTHSEKREYLLSNIANYQYYRIKMLNNSGGTTVSLYSKGNLELQLYSPVVPLKIQTVSSTLPTQEKFLEEGMDSLSPLLDRRVETLEPLEMTEDSTQIESGKLFSKTLNLKKYVDIRNVKVDVK